MIEDLISIGWRPTLIGLVVLVIGAVTGWGIAGDGGFSPVRWLRVWMERVILPGLRQKSWAGRWAVIFLNNATICAALIGAARWRGGAWVGVVLVGLALGAAIRLLQAPDWEIQKDADNAPEAPAPPADRLVALGLLLNLLEVPAIIIALGLAMGRLALPNSLVADDVWRMYACWVAPLLLVAAGGEALWIGRRSPF